MNLYAIMPVYAPYNEVTFTLAESDSDALQHGVFEAAHDVTEGYHSPSADVYLIAENVRHVGKSYATDAPRQWQWAHPAVEENAAEEAVTQAAYDAGLWP